MGYIKGLLTLILCPFVLRATMQGCRYLEYIPKDSGDYAFCSTGWITASTRMRTYQISYDADFINAKSRDQLDEDDVLCVMAGIQVDVSQSQNPAYTGVQGCRASFQEDGGIAAWVVSVEPHTACDFLCIAYRYRHHSTIGESQAEKSCITERKLTDTVNFLDAVYINKRAISAGTTNYQRFCGLSAFITSQFCQPFLSRSVLHANTPEFGYCQLIPDRERWMGTAWMGTPQKSLVNSHIGCRVNCYDDDADRQNNNGLMVSHAIYDTKPKYVAQFNGDVQCSLSYINIQPAHTMRARNQWVGCGLKADIEMGQWKMNVTNSTDYIVECGVVCSCNTGPTTNHDGYECIRPILPANSHENVQTSVRSVSVGWTIPVLGIVLVVCVWLHQLRTPGRKNRRNRKEPLIV